MSDKIIDYRPSHDAMWLVNMCERLEKAFSGDDFDYKREYYDGLVRGVEMVKELVKDGMIKDGQEE